MNLELFYNIMLDISKAKSLRVIFIEEKILGYKNDKVVDLLIECLKNLHGLLKFIVRVGLLELGKDVFDEIQKLLDKHTSLLLFEISEKSDFNLSNLDKRLMKYVSNQLRDQYKKYITLNECQVVFMGDGRVGKTSTIRNLFRRPFLLDSTSTLVLNNIDIFSIKPHSYEWKFISKYELSFQRVKNSLPRIVNYDFNPNQKVKTKYKLDFEKELLARAAYDKNYIEGMKTDSYGFATNDVYFHVYDFGGQEIFSSVHHIFMNSNTLFFVVFNMTKISQNDLFRLKFWCESIIRNAPGARIMFVGTFLRRYMRKNVKDPNLEAINQRIWNFIKTLSSNLFLLKNTTRAFFPIENSTFGDSKQVQCIKDKVSGLVSEASGFAKESFFGFQVGTAQVLFLDNCREQATIMTLKEFEDKSYSCGFSAEEVEEMLEIYSRVGLISYFPDLDLEAGENFIFFAPSYLAQALGRFIRDPIFHQLAFRIDRDFLPHYRMIFASGILSLHLFENLLREYSEEEIKYILSLALKSLVLIHVEKENDVFILPELLPELKRSTIKPSFKSDIKLVFQSFVRLAAFVRAVSLFLKDEDIHESLLFKGFARITFKNKRIVDIFLSTETEISFTLVQGNNLKWLNENVERISEELQEAIENDVIYEGNN
eukprot:snap_masked-scaffold_11-processed-gene-12.49-mRNA-1 protein AED:1.00 eAED:1.00 QI:0/0/0/0/1/1/3/0/653